MAATPYWTMGPDRSEATRGDAVHLLPIYDEYLVAYRDREAVPHGPSVIASLSGKSVNFQHALVIDGQVAGTGGSRVNSRQSSSR